MHEKDLDPFLDQINTELKEIEAARRSAHHAAGALRRKLEGWGDIAGEDKPQQWEEAASEWRQLEASLRGLRDSAQALSRSVRKRKKQDLTVPPVSDEPGAPPENGSPEGPAYGGEPEDNSEGAYGQMFLINENQIKILSAIDSLKKHVDTTAGLHDRWLLALAAGLILNLALCLGFLYQGVNVAASPVDGNRPPAVVEAESGPPEEEPAAEEAEKEEAAELPPAKAPSAQPVSSASLISPKAAEALIGARAGYALVYLKQKAFSRLAAKYFHPEKGIHFLPLGLQAAGRRFPAEAAESAVDKSTVYDWGVVDGAPAEMKFEDYYRQYIFDVDFSQGSEKHYNELHYPGASGLSAQQIARRFPDCAFAEYHKGGSSLVLVFEKWSRDNNWYLSAAIHNQ